MNCRRNVSDLSPTEKQEFVQALIDLKQAPSQIAAAQAAGGQGRYDDYVWIHEQVRGAAHNAPAFIPWHREFLYQFERDLQTVSGNPNLTIPYWDWTKARSPANAGWPFTADFIGGLGTSAADSRVTTGRFATDPADPGATEWRINIPDVETGNYLKRRGAAEEFALPTLATARNAMGIAVFDAAPYIITAAMSDAEFNAAVNASFRKFLEFALHNGPHPWVGTQAQFNAFGAVTNAPITGSMTWQSSPNDPTFWLHHCNIDRLWAIWQQRYDYPGYIPQSGGPALQDGPDVMGMYNIPSYFNFPQHTTPNSNENHRVLNYIYYSDVPEVSPPMPLSVGFGDVPVDTVTYKPVQFSVTSCQPVKFRITAVSGTGFSDPYPGAHTVNPSGDSTFVADVYVAYSAPPAGSGSVSGSVTVQAFFEDPDRLYVPTAAPSDEYIIDTWTINLDANLVGRPRAAITLVLDRSGSMSLPAGGGLERFDLLEGAVEVIRDLSRPLDALGLVYYDHNVVRQMNITAMDAAGVTLVNAALTDPSLEPSGGSTAIGSGMIEGADVLTDEMGLPGTPYERFAMLVLTDGNENVLPYANQPPVTSAVASFSSEVYAIGLGREGEVSDATLGAIANYMLITGDMNADEREFRVTKYFIQIIAGATNMNIVVDPDGHLTFGVEHRIEFDLTTGDMEADIIALSPLAFLIDMKLEAPDGSIFTPGNIAPNGTFSRNIRDIFYRLRLPVQPDAPDKTHGGKWTAILSLSPERVKEFGHRLENFPELLKNIRSGYIPFSVVVQTYSNISLNVRVEQTSQLNGGVLQFFATLNQYNVPLAYSGHVRVMITDPLGSVKYVELHEEEPGRFTGELPTTVTGIYRCRFLASGYTIEGEYFTREQTRTAPIYRLLPVAALPDPPNNDGSAADRICRLIACLLEDSGIQELFARYGINSDRIRECLAEACKRQRQPSIERGIGIVREEIKRQSDTVETARELTKRLAHLLVETGPLHILETPKPEPVEVASEQEIPMNPLGGMWPVVETEDGELAILLKSDEGHFSPPQERWKQEESEEERREPKLPDPLLKRLQDSSKKGGRKRSK